MFLKLEIRQIHLVVCCVRHFNESTNQNSEPKKEIFAIMESKL